MKANKNKILIILLATVIVLITAFIFYHSTKNNQESHDASGVVSDIFVPGEINNDKISDFFMNIGENMPDIEDPTQVTAKDVFEAILRKAAHFLEYAVLGCAVAGFAIALSNYRKYSVNFLGFELLYVLLVAVFDEHFQSFSDRSSSTVDIFIDFAGALTGIVLIHFIFYIIKRKKSKNRKNAEE